MAQCKKDVTPLLMHWSYVFIALTYRFAFIINQFIYLSIWLGVLLSLVSGVNSIGSLGPICKKFYELITKIF